MIGRIVTRPSDTELSKIKETIYRERNSGAFRELIVYIDAAGKLALEGYEIGPTVLRIWGDSDYEYWVSVMPEDKPRVLAALRQESPALPKGLEERMRNPADAEHAEDWELILRVKEGFLDREKFKAWLKAHGINFDFISWA